MEVSRTSHLMMFLLAALLLIGWYLTREKRTSTSRQNKPIESVDKVAEFMADYLRVMVEGDRSALRRALDIWRSEHRLAIVEAGDLEAWNDQVATYRIFPALQDFHVKQYIGAEEARAVALRAARTKSITDIKIAVAYYYAPYMGTEVRTALESTGLMNDLMMRATEYDARQGHAAV